MHFPAGMTLSNRPIIVLSNREPYRHDFDPSGSGIKSTRSVSGVVSTLEPVLLKRGGVWIAQASGSADRERLELLLTSIREAEQRLQQDQAWAKKPKPKVSAAAIRQPMIESIWSSRLSVNCAASRSIRDFSPRRSRRFCWPILRRRARRRPARGWIPCWQGLRILPRGPSG